MGILHSPDSAYAKEMTRWEAQGSTMGPGLRPYVKYDYPMMVHLAGSLPKGGVGILEQIIVEDDTRRTAARSVGYRDTPLEAIDAFNEQQLEYAKLAAERNFEVRRMSAHAQREVVQAEADAGAQHLPTIPPTPIKRRPRGRPRKPAFTETKE